MTCHSETSGRLHTSALGLPRLSSGQASSRHHHAVLRYGGIQIGAPMRPHPRLALSTERQRSDPTRCAIAARGHERRVKIAISFDPPPAPDRARPFTRLPRNRFRFFPMGGR